MYDLKQKQDELLNARASEMDMLMHDLDKLTERAAGAERLVEQYQKSLEASSHEAAHSRGDELNKQQLDAMRMSNLRVSGLEVELVAKDKEISQLVEDVQKLHAKSSKVDARRPYGIFFFSLRPLFFFFSSKIALRI